MEEAEIKDYIKEHLTVSLSINFITNPKKKYVVFKPVINFISTQKKVIEEVNAYLGLNQNIYIIKYEQRIRYELRVQNFESLQIVINKVKAEGITIKSNFELFCDIFTEVKKIGHIHTEYSDDFKQIVDKKLLLNKETRTRKSMSSSVWLKKIKEHLH